MSNSNSSPGILFSLFLATVLLTAVPSPAQDVITTVAGSTWVPRGGEVAANVSLGRVQGVEVDPLGNVFGADPDSHLVLKISPQGVLSVVAGNGGNAFAGDGGPATAASMVAPVAVALDRAGNLYIADRADHRVRKVGLDGVITTVAGDGGDRFSGDGIQGINTSLNSPTGVAVDNAGNLYIADRDNHRIRKVGPDGIISTVAGSGAGFSGDGGPATAALLRAPNGVEVDGAGNLYIADRDNHRIRKVGPDGIISTIAGTGTADFSGDDGPASRASLYSPFAVALDGSGNLYIADANNTRVRRVDLRGIITTFAGSGFWTFSGDGARARDAALAFPTGVAVDTARNLYIADSENNRVRRVNTDGLISTLAGGGNPGDGGPAAAAVLRDPMGVAVDGAGNLYITDQVQHRIRKVGPTGIITTVAGTGIASFAGDGGPATRASLRSPVGVEVDAAGNLYIADTNNHRIRKVSPPGTISTVAGNGAFDFSGDSGPAVNASLRLPSGVAVDGAGNLYIADTNNHRIRKVSPPGTISTVAGNGTGTFSGDGGPALNASLQSPGGVAVDVAGNLYIADTDNHRIRRVGPTGIISTVAGTGTAGFSGDGGAATLASLRFPFGVEVDAAGNLYIADTSNQRIRKVSAAGIISTVVGDGEARFFGDGGPALSASLFAPTGVAVDAAGKLYIAEFGNDRIRMVEFVRPSVGGVVNGASFTAQPTTAGSIGSLFGTNLAASTASAISLPLPTSLAGVTVTLNGIPAPLVYVSLTQINFQFPWELSGQAQVSITVTAPNGLTSAPQTFSMTPFNPGIFAIGQPTGQGAILIAQTGEIAAPDGSIQGRATRPARRGEFLTIYCTGLGAVGNRPASGAAAGGDPLSPTTATPTVSIGGAPASISFSGLAPGFVGLYQINAPVPADSPTGTAVPVVLTIGGVSSNTVTIAVE